MADFTGKVEELEYPGIVGVTETWAKSNETYNLKDYIQYRNDRSDGYGGTILYVKTEIEQRVCRPLNDQGFDNSAWCWIVEKGGKKTLVGVVYRSPNSSEENDNLLKEKLRLANDIAGNNRLLILGDFNLPHIDWEENYLRAGAKRVERDMLEVINDCHLQQHVREDTRFESLQSSSLDLIFTREEGDVRNIDVQHPLAGSDHGIVVADFVSEWQSRVVHRPKRQYSRGKYDKITEELDQENWREKFEGKSVQECWEIFKAKIKELVEKYIPMGTPRDYNEPWMNKKLLNQWKKKYHAWKRYTGGKSYRRYEEYKKEANILKKKVRQAKRAYEKKLAKGIRHNKRGFFKYVRSKLTVRPEITQMQNENGGLVDKDGDIVSIMGRYFSSVYSQPSREAMPEMNEMYTSEIQELKVSRQEVQSRLEKLNTNKSCGPDDIHPRLLQETAKAVSIPLEIIFNLSLNSGKCPTDWRTANVTPIHKKGSRTDPGNYRPVSLTSQVCKVLEAIVRKHIIEHLESNDILSDKQHGFREGRSCLTNLLELMESWTQILDEDDGIDVAYLDFRKAFDLVSHPHLLYKMSKYGIKNHVLNWVKAFLGGRTQRVLIRGTASESFEVTSGVPQGSVLGPILFLIFINDLPLEIISPLSLFADDTKIFTRIISEMSKTRQRGSYGSEVLQRDLNSVMEWANKWKMEFNVDKCKIMHLGKLNPRHVYSMDGVELTVTTEEKDLGVLVDDKLDFGKHISEIVKKANRRIGLIKKGFDCLDKEMFMYLYPVLIRPLLEYCVQIWSPHKQGDIDLLERVQRRATKIVPALRNLSYAERLQRLNLTTLEERRIRGDMIETYKILTGKEDINPSKFFTMAQTRGDPNLRHNMRIYKPGPNKEIRKCFMAHRVIDRWNLLDKDVVEVDKTSTFKRRYDKWVAERRGASDASPYLYYFRAFRPLN